MTEDSSPHIFNRLRIPLLGLAILILLAALWGGVVRIGWRWQAPGLVSAPLAHGPLMVSGFLGTLIALERAVALRRRWTYIPPLLSGLGAVFLLSQVDFLTAAGPVFITLGSLGLVAVFGLIIRMHTAAYTVTMGAGALAWLAGNLIWLAGRPVFQLVLWWAAFLVLTIAGERLELGRMARLSPRANRLFLAAAAVFGLGLMITLVDLDLGTRLAAAGMLLLAAWLGRYDIARRTIRKPGLPRYAAICLLTGYVWLAAAGFMGLDYGVTAAGPLYDAFLHAIFVGFVFSMIFGHAPIIFPAVLGLPVAFQPRAYAYLALLHLGLIVRVAGDLSGAQPVRLWGGLLNGIAILIFLASNGLAILQARRAAAAERSELKTEAIQQPRADHGPV